MRVVLFILFQDNIRPIINRIIPKSMFPRSIFKIPHNTNAVGNIEKNIINTIIDKIIVIIYAPVLPKLPSPRTVSSSSSTHDALTCGYGRMIN